MTTPSNAPQPGEQRPPATSEPPATAPRLDRPPGERYERRSGAGEPPPAVGRSRSRGILAALFVAVVGAVVVAVLGLIDLSLGLVAVAGGIGWAVGEALRWGAGGAPGDRPMRTSIGGTLAAASVVVGLLGIWAWARFEGGVLDPIAYLGERYGLLAPVMVVVAALVGIARAR